MTFLDCTADLVGQLNGNGQKGMLQIDAPTVENFLLRQCLKPTVFTTRRNASSVFAVVMCPPVCLFVRHKIVSKPS